MLRSFGSVVLRFLMPWVCAGCRRTLPDLLDPGYCDPCWLHLPRITGMICRRCGLPLPEGGNRCWSCRRSSSPLLVRAAGLYSGGLRKGLLRFKFDGRQSLAEPFGRLLEHAWRRYPEIQSAGALVPVPLHPRRRRQRGYNQAQLLAESLGRRLSLRVYPDLLLRRRSTRPQTAFDRDGRWRNLKGVFSVSRPEDLRYAATWLLIDDVATSTATLAECARTLRRAGARRVAALVLARDPSPELH